MAIFSNASQVKAARELEQLRLESSLILKAFEPKDEADRSSALKFLLEAGLIRDNDGKIAKLATKRVPYIPVSGSGSAPVNEPPSSFIQRWEGGSMTDAEIASAQATAKAVADESGVSSPLATKVISDSVVQHGQDTTRKFAEEATAKMGGLGNAKVDGADWLSAFLDARRAYIQRNMPSAIQALRRVDELQQQVKASATPAAK